MGHERLPHTQELSVAVGRSLTKILVATNAEGPCATVYTVMQGPSEFCGLAYGPTRSCVHGHAGAVPQPTRQPGAEVPRRKPVRQRYYPCSPDRHLNR